MVERKESLNRTVMARNKERKPYVSPEMSIYVIEKTELLATSIYIYRYEEEDALDDETLN